LRFLDNLIDQKKTGNPFVTYAKGKELFINNDTTTRVTILMLDNSMSTLENFFFLDKKELVHN
jgi:hypothetical protein